MMAPEAQSESRLLLAVDNGQLLEVVDWFLRQTQPKPTVA